DGGGVDAGIGILPGRVDRHHPGPVRSGEGGGEVGGEGTGAREQVRLEDHQHAAPTLLRLDDGAGGLDGGGDLARVVRVVVHDRDAARDAGDVEAARGPGEGGQAGGQRRRVEVRRGGGDRGQRSQGVEDVVVPGHRQFEAQRTVRGVDLDLGTAR